MSSVTLGTQPCYSALRRMLHFCIRSKARWTTTMGELTVVFLKTNSISLQPKAQTYTSQQGSKYTKITLSFLLLECNMLNWNSSILIGMEFHPSTSLKDHQTQCAMAHSKTIWSQVSLNPHNLQFSLSGQLWLTNGTANCFFVKQ